MRRRQRLHGLLGITCARVCEGLLERLSHVRVRAGRRSRTQDAGGRRCFKGGLLCGARLVAGACLCSRPRPPLLRPPFVSANLQNESRKKPLQQRERERGLRAMRHDSSSGFGLLGGFACRERRRRRRRRRNRRGWEEAPDRAACGQLAGRRRRQLGQQSHVGQAFGAGAHTSAGLFARPSSAGGRRWGAICAGASPPFLYSHPPPPPLSCSSPSVYPTICTKQQTTTTSRRRRGRRRSRCGATGRERRSEAVSWGRRFARTRRQANSTTKKYTHTQAHTQLEGTLVLAVITHILPGAFAAVCYGVVCGSLLSPFASRAQQTHSIHTAHIHTDPPKKQQQALTTFVSLHPAGAAL